jgi:hypothetical protein
VITRVLDIGQRSPDAFEDEKELLGRDGFLSRFVREVLQRRP